MLGNFTQILLKRRRSILWGRVNVYFSGRFLYLPLPFLPVGSEPPQLTVSEERHLAILTELPFVVPFEERVKVTTTLPT